MTHSTSWGGRSVAFVVGAVLSAAAFATGSPNSPLYALRNSSQAASDETCGTATPAPEPTPAESTPAGSASAEPSTPAEPSSEPAPASCPSEEAPEPSPSSAPPSEAPEVEAPAEAEVEAEDANHGEIVRTVAKCAPRGKDPLFEQLDDTLGSHGAFVRAAAHGDSLTTPWGTYDLSTLAGAEALCAAVETARAELASASPAPEREKQNQKSKPSKTKPSRDDGQDG